jgi:hypothetical protein
MMTMMTNNYFPQTRNRRRTIIGILLFRLLVFLLLAVSVLAFTSSSNINLQTHHWGIRGIKRHGSFRVVTSGISAAIEDDDHQQQEEKEDSTIPLEVDIAIVGAGLGGLCAGAILNTLYNKRVAVFESHYLAGGCAHAFDRKAKNGETFTFDSGPTIVLGCVLCMA